MTSLSSVVAGLLVVVLILLAVTIGLLESDDAKLDTILQSALEVADSAANHSAVMLSVEVDGEDVIVSWQGSDGVRVKRKGITVRKVMR